MKYKSIKQRIEESYIRRITKLSKELDELEEDFHNFNLFKDDLKFNILKEKPYIYSWKCDIVKSEIKHYLIFNTLE